MSNEKKIIPIAGQKRPEFSCPKECFGSCCSTGITIEKYDAGNILAFAEKNFEDFENHFKNKQYTLQDVVGGGAPYGVPVIGKRIPYSSFGFFRHIKEDVFGNRLERDMLHTSIAFDQETSRPGSCVFLTDKKTCFLEDVAAKLGLHRWYAKPLPCIAFPLVLTPEGEYSPVSSPENNSASATNAGLVDAYGDKECCKVVTPESYNEVMHDALSFIREHAPKRKERYARLMSTLKSHVLSKGFSR